MEIHSLVSLLPYFQFGAIVIVDPTWTPEFLRDHAASDFYRALEVLSQRLSNHGVGLEHQLSALQPAVEHALVCVVEAVAGPAAALHINEFLDDFVDDLRIPRMPGYV